MLKTIYWYAHFMGTALLSLGKLKKANTLFKTGDTFACTQFTHQVTSAWARKQIKAANATVIVHGKENLIHDEAVIFMSNHQGNFDVAIFMGCIDVPKGYVSKIEIAKLPIISTWMRYMHCVFMDRSTLRTSAQAIVEGVKSVQAGHSLVIFPEGTRSRSSVVGEFKGGSFKLATKSGAPIIPVTINGSYKLMEGNNGKVRSGEVHVTIHPPIQTKNLTKEALTALPETVKQTIASALPHEGKPISHTA